MRIRLPRRKPPRPEADPAAGPALTLYRRNGCSLCDQAELVIAPLAARLGFRIERIDIESDDGLLKRYMFEIPVVAYAGRDLLAWPFSEARLEDALHSAIASG
ncbi:MAG: glutaredoxin family protein [Dehalococcoidia bacterium]|nr:MAG: glutaredoxin family protein [bacterium]MCE7927028.1 glutaredoxin family protein [Chloroflexi bacterium CFX7]MCL4232147.1 glutaredoxin family protein [Dehalococcoidia bacterium]NUQ56343.1 glutaredoxin family protein [Dehalococcoidia bacterium]